MNLILFSKNNFTQSRNVGGNIFHAAFQSEIKAAGGADAAMGSFFALGQFIGGDGIGGMDEAIKGEFASNGFDNPLSHERGVVSLARTMDPNSASGQFFIMHDDGEFLDGNYAAFGKVTKGMEYVDEIAEMPTYGEMLVEKPVIESMVIIED